MKRNVIITCSNRKSGSFVANHWIRSIKENVNLKNIDIAVMDYGLSVLQKKKLENNGVIIFKGMDKYHIVNKRFFDAGRFLKKNDYDQVLFVDGSDVIFQDDVSNVFRKDKNIFRVVALDMEVLFFEWFISIQGNFEERIKEKIWKVVKNKPVINAGVIFAPVKPFIKLCEEMQRLIKNKWSFGPDQIIVNYLLYKTRFKFIDCKYNFMMSTVKENFAIKDGVFYKSNGEKVVIVHNAGQIDLFRPVENFGYGKKYNNLKHFIYHAKRSQYALLALYKKIFK